MLKTPIKINWQLHHRRLKIHKTLWSQSYCLTNHKQTKHANEWREPFSRIILALFVMCIYGSKLIEIEHKSRTPNLRLGTQTEPNDDKNFKKNSTCLIKTITIWIQQVKNWQVEISSMTAASFGGCYLLYSIWHIASAFGLSLYMLIQHSHSCCK